MKTFNKHTYQKHRQNDHEMYIYYWILQQFNRKYTECSNYTK